MSDLKPNTLGLNLGDVVRLKSGGCQMVVTMAYPYMVDVEWHDVLGKPHSGRYFNTSLEKL